MTLKIRSRSLKPKQLFIKSQCYIHADLVKIHQPVHEIWCTLGLSGKFVDTACFHCFLYTFQTCFTYYNSVIQEWIKYNIGIVLCNIYTQCLLLWKRRVEATGARQNFLNLIHQILFLSFHVIISKQENVVKLNIDVRQTSNVTCENFKWRHDFDINEMIFCCVIQWMKSLKKMMTSGVSLITTDHHRPHHRPQCKLLMTHKINISTSKMRKFTKFDSFWVFILLKLVVKMKQITFYSISPETFFGYFEADIVCQYGDITV